MLYLSFLVFFIHVAGLDAERIADQTPVEGDEESYKRTISVSERDAFSNNFDTCMIHKWIRNKVLKTSPTASCSSPKHSRLCYGLKSDRPADAQFISCYNTETLIPEFTAHAVPYTGVRPNKSNNPIFIQDNGIYAPNPQSKSGDCNRPATAVGEYFCSRGHLTPKAAYDTEDRRNLTFIMTNVAPQWQKFNAGNWAAVEGAVKRYVNAVRREVYVFTGTAGKVKKWAQGWLWIPWRKPYKTGTGRIVVPKYFWKAVCDPVVKQSIVFIAENNVDETSNATTTQGTCLGQRMQKQNGLVECYSMSTIQTGIKQRFLNWWHGFKFPDFDPTNCGTATIGTFLDNYLKFK